MTVEQLKALSSAQPFRTFVLETIAGNYIKIDKVDHVIFPPSDHVLIIVFANNGLIHHIKIDQINSWAVT